MTQATPILAGPSRRQSFIAAFRALARDKKLTSELMALRALVLHKPFGEAFSPITCPVKLANGARPWQAVEAALSPFTSLRRFEAHAGARQLLAGGGFELQDLLVDAIREASDSALWDAEYALRGSTPPQETSASDQA